MMPVGPLMVEHRLIERMIRLIEAETRRISLEGNLDIVFIGRATDFIRAYADRCHHGKEEDILFRDLARKKMSKEHQAVMEELIEEHAFGRRTTRDLVAARDRALRGDRTGTDEAVRLMQELAAFYPKHIEKEDKHFFLPAMDYFSAAEQEAMLREFDDFDRRLIHERYKTIVEEMEQKGRRVS